MKKGEKEFYISLVKAIFVALVVSFLMLWIRNVVFNEGYQQGKQEYIQNLLNNCGNDYSIVIDNAEGTLAYVKIPNCEYYKTFCNKEGDFCINYYTNDSSVLRLFE